MNKPVFLIRCDAMFRNPTPEAFVLTAATRSFTAATRVLAVAFLTLAGLTALSGCGPADAGNETGGPEPVNKNATLETKALFHNLRVLSDDYTLFGHQDALAYGVHWINEPGRSDVMEITGSYPAVYGWELGDLELGSPENLDGVNFEQMKGWIREGFLRGGVITISWHMNNPATGGNSWDTEGEAVRKILPGGELHETFKTWLDTFAGFLNDLYVQEGDAIVRIPVIFRPWHEHTGSWFWWGQDIVSTEEYVALWRFTVDYMHHEKGVNNLLWAYSPYHVDDFERYMERYPGDNYVDILGYDAYNLYEDGGSRDSSIRILQHMADYARKHGKVAAFTETGNSTIYVPNWFTERLYPAIARDGGVRGIGYVLVWRNANAETDRVDHYYAPYPGHPAEEDFLRLFQKPDILFEDDLPKMYDFPKP